MRHRRPAQALAAPPREAQCCRRALRRRTELRSGLCLWNRDAAELSERQAAREASPAWRQLVAFRASNRQSLPLTLPHIADDNGSNASGTGGMAEVWLAEDQRLRRWVAVKVLRESFSAEADAATIAAFEREATVIARLQHQSIVGVYDAGAHDGRRYIVMEYVHGYSLRQLLKRRSLTEAEAIATGADSGALQHANGQE